MTSTALAQEKIWFNKSAYDKAECFHYENLTKMDKIAALAGIQDNSGSEIGLHEKETQDVQNNVEKLFQKLDVREQITDKHVSQTSSINETNLQKSNSVNAKVDEDINLFGSDSEDDDAEAAKIREERLAAYAAKKSKKPALIAKSSIILDVKPWDDETDMKLMEIEVRKIEKDGLLWGAAKLVPVAFKIQKLQISCVVEDEKISVDWLTDQIQEIEEFVQSVDIAAFNKV